MHASGVGQQRHAPRNDTYLSHTWCLPRAEADVLPLHTHHKSPREPPGSSEAAQEDGAGNMGEAGDDFCEQQMPTAPFWAVRAQLHRRALQPHHAAAQSQPPEPPCPKSSKLSPGYMPTGFTQISSCSKATSPTSNPGRKAFGTTCTKHPNTSLPHPRAHHPLPQAVQELQTGPSTASREVPACPAAAGRVLSTPRVLQSHQGLLQAEQQHFNPAPHSRQLQLLPHPAGSSSGTQQGGTPLGGTCKLQAPSSWASRQGTKPFLCLEAQRAARLSHGASSTFMWLAWSSKRTQP